MSFILAPGFTVFMTIRVMSFDVHGNTGEQFMSEIDQQSSIHGRATTNVIKTPTIFGTNTSVISCICVTA